ncbi:polysaccharide biosynthesis protein [Halobacterium sp. DL1]|jgi:O-antigen/teichoic acid export membrane protein|nr:polysaccharide biosynthesis protein [Halobacterium sp. DL1]
MTEPSELSLGGEAAKGTVAKFGMAIVGFLGTVVFARALGPNSFGGYYLLLTAVQLTIRPVGGWAEAGKKRFSETASDGRSILGSVIAGYVLWTAVAAVGGLLAADVIVEYTGLNAGPVLFVVLVATIGLFEASERLVEATGMMSVTTAIDAVRSYVTFGTQLLLVVGAGAGVVGLALGLAAASLLVVPLLLYVLATAPVLPSREIVESLGSFAVYSVPAELFNTTFDNIDLLLIGALLAADYAGDYQVAFALVVPATFVSEVAAGGLMSRVSNLRSKRRDVVMDVTNSLSYTSVLALPLFAGALALNEPLIRVFFGTEYQTAPALLVGLALARIIMTQNRPLSHVLRGLDDPRADMRVSIVALGLNVVLGVTLGYAYGVYGIVAATIVSEAVRYAALAFVVRRQLGNIELLPRPLLEQTVAAAGMLAIVVGVRSLVTIRGWVSLAVVVSVGVTGYFVLLLGVSRQTRAMLRSVAESLGYASPLSGGRD